jgi:hypothetical protein
MCSFAVVRKMNIQLGAAPTSVYFISETLKEFRSRLAFIFG